MCWPVRGTAQRRRLASGRRALRPVEQVQVGKVIWMEITALNHFISLTPTLLSLGLSGQKYNQTRFRVIVQQPANGGTDCPEVLYEERECEVPRPASVCTGYRYTVHPVTLSALSHHTLVLA